MVADQSNLERGPGAFRIAERRGDAGVRDRDHDVRVDPRFLGQLPAQGFARQVDRVRPEDLAVRPGKVHVFEHAHRGLGLREGPVAADAVLVQHDQFARFDLSHTIGSDQIESAGFGGHQPTLLHAPQAERAESVRVPGGDHTLVGQQHDRERAAHLVERIDDPCQEGVRPGVRDQVDDHLAVRRGLEDRPVGLEFVAQHRRIDEIAVVRQCQISE